ncbi:unnamed protein product [Linum tenue]|uniref:AB hydrolase-1 domain-containing protein n=1 Tax=Linum tenue TaxID=586396 RepID=A0AAV0IJ79_9ROSI|nr:unnamed protein product [Linum tenue]
MAATTAGARFSFSPVIRCCAATPAPADKLKLNPVQLPTRRLFAVSSQQVSTSAGEVVSFPLPAQGEGIGTESLDATATANQGKEDEQIDNPYAAAVRTPQEAMQLGKTVKDYFVEAKGLIQSTASDGGGHHPHWISPAEDGCGSPTADSPLFLYLPGIDGVGLGLIRQHHNLCKLFNVSCLHIPAKDRTSLRGLVQLVEKTVRAEYGRSPRRPIYICGESLGACIALAVAARNPGIDLVLILANPGTSFEKSQLQSLMPLLDLLPDNFHLNVPIMLGLMTGDPVKTFMDNLVRGLPLPQATGGLTVDVLAMSSHLSILSEILPKETLLWKLQLLETASSYANARLRAVKAQILILSSGKDQLLPSNEESQRLRAALPKSVIRTFDDNGHFLFLEDGVDLVTTLKGSLFYRRRKHRDFVTDYIPPTPLEFKNIDAKYRELEVATSPVMFSTLQDGTIVKGLSGIPSEGPVLIVGYHMLLGVELSPMVTRILKERNILVRGIAHPMMFSRVKEGRMPPLSSFDDFRVMGAVPVSGPVLFKLLSSRAHVLLYPGGMREACHRKGEEYQLHWPEQSEFVRMAARFGAKIVPFGVVGEDDYGEVVFDYEDQMKIPFFRYIIESTTEEIPQVRTDAGGELALQGVHFPVFRPKLPGRFYYLFGKPIETQGREEELSKDREKANEVYMEVKQEVYNCIDYLKEKRESDPYRNVVARMAYQAIHGLDAPVPTFEL